MNPEIMFFSGRKYLFNNHWKRHWSMCSDP